MAQYKVLNNFAPEFSTSSTYSVGDLVMYLGTLYICTNAVNYAGTFTGASNWSQANIIGTSSKVTANPVGLVGTEPELLAMAISGVNYQAQKLYQTDGITFALGEPDDFTLGSNYSSYCRIGKTIVFVLSCDITRTGAGDGNPVQLGIFNDIPTAIFDKLVGGVLLDEAPTIAYASGGGTVDAPTAVVKGSQNDLSIFVDPTNLVNGTTYHIRHVSIFLLTDNLIGGGAISADAVLDNNSWDVIKAVCEAGEAANYWNVGDVKNDTGTDGYTRSFRIVDMSGLYGKHVVFEQMETEGTDGSGATGVVWDTNNSNAWETSTIRTTTLPSVLLRYSNNLQSVITTTNIQTAENGNSSTLVTTNDKLFLEAEKEVGLNIYSASAEQNALTTYSYYVSHNTNNDRIKYNQANTARGWWLRSLASGYADSVCRVINNGDADYSNANGTYRFAPCFSF